MQELVPIALGAALGVGSLALRRPVARAAALVVGALVIGVLWSTLAGEAAESPVFIAWDSAQALVSGLLCRVLWRLGPGRAGRAASGRAG